MNIKKYNKARQCKEINKILLIKICFKILNSVSFKKKLNKVKRHRFLKCKIINRLLI